MVIFVCNPNTGIVEAGGSGVHGHSQQCSEFKTSLGYMYKILFDVKQKSLNKVTI